MNWRWQPKAIVDKHTKVHVGGCALLALIFGMISPQVGFLVANGLGLLNEIKDGFMPAVRPWASPLKILLTTSDGFSWSDLMFNALGSVVGTMLSALIMTTEPTGGVRLMVALFGVIVGVALCLRAYPSLGGSQDD